jgi:predicted lipoprotein with Yx(FWY)xxD motif
MRRSLLALAPAVVAIAIAGCGGSSNHNGNGATAQAGAKPAATTQSSSATVGARNTKFGTILVDAEGRSLYLFEQDKGMSSTCYGACASIWPPLTVSGSPKPGAGIVASKLSTTKRKDGQAEVTYNGHPLYYYAGDQKPGDTAGEGLNQFGAPWDVLSTTGKGIDGD